MLKGKITGIRGEDAELSLQNGQVLVVPLSAIEGEAQIGQEAVLVVAVTGSEDAGRQHLARHLLNELLKG
jgi:polynucleotide 5'-kinase involved in rRNA processing